MLLKNEEAVNLIKWLLKGLAQKPASGRKGIENESVGKVNIISYCLPCFWFFTVSAVS